MLTRSVRRISWVLQVVVAVILGQTLFFKFTAAPESVYIFETLGAEPWGRIGSGLVELLAVVLILAPWRPVYGALLALAVMAGAVCSHLTQLGIVVQDDGGTLFAMALVTLVSAATVVLLRRQELRAPGRAVAESANGR